MFEEIDLALKLHKITGGDPKILAARDGVEMATIGGARALHLEDQIGSLEPGKRADLIVLGTDAPWAQPLYDVYSHLAYALKGMDVVTTIVNGRVLMEDGRHADARHRGRGGARARVPRAHRGLAARAMSGPAEPPRRARRPCASSSTSTGRAVLVTGAGRASAA